MSEDKWSEYTDRKAEEWRKKLAQYTKLKKHHMSEFVKDVMPGHRFVMVSSWDRQVINEYNVTVLKAMKNKDLVEKIFDYITGPESSKEVRAVNPLQYIKERKYVMEERIREAIEEFVKVTGVTDIQITVDDNGVPHVDVGIKV